MKQVVNAVQSRIFHVGAAGLLWLGLSAAQACDEPVVGTDIPDGRSASQEAMLAAQEAINAYVSAGEEYIKCVETSEGAAVANRLRNDMLDKMEKVAAQFNRQLRYFRRSNS